MPPFLFRFPLGADRHPEGLAQADPIPVPRLDDPSQHAHVEPIVLVNGDVPETHHPVERCRQRFVDKTCPLQKREGVGLALRNAEVSFRNDVHRRVDRGLAAPFNVRAISRFLNRCATGVTGLDFLYQAT